MSEYLKVVLGPILYAIYTGDLKKHDKITTCFCCNSHQLTKDRDNSTVFYRVQYCSVTILDVQQEFDRVCWADVLTKINLSYIFYLTLSLYLSSLFFNPIFTIGALYIKANKDLGYDVYYLYPRYSIFLPSYVYIVYGRFFVIVPNENSGIACNLL